MKGALPLVGSLALYKHFFSYLGCSSWLVKNIFFLTVHYFNSFVPIPIAQQAGHVFYSKLMVLLPCIFPKFRTPDQRSNKLLFGYYMRARGIQTLML
jgi:hypothetical protein